MNILKTKSNAWGQEVLEGANLELVTAFIAAGIALIILHALAVVWRTRKGLPRDE